MPDGVVQWFDPTTGDGRILHAGRRFAARAEDMEPKARTPGARVHFDIDHDAPGSVATAVRLRRGRRVSHRQRRFGDLVGASSLDTKGNAPFNRERPDLGPSHERNPMRVAELWAEWVSTGDLEAAMQLYAPDAVLHVEGEPRTGPKEIRAQLEASPLLRGPLPGEIRGDGTDGVLLRWAPEEPDGVAETRLRMAHGEIAEQWVGAVWSVEPAREGLTMDLSVAGRVSEGDRRYAVEKISKVVGTLDDPILHAEIRLERATNPARERPAMARVTIDVDGEPVRAHVAGREMHEAVDLLEERLRHRLEAIANHRKLLKQRGPASPEGEWRHGDLPSPRPSYFPRPAEERQVVRRKTFSTPRATVDEAVFDLESMDHDFFLFTDLATGEDALVHRSGGGAYGLQFVGGGAHAERPPFAAAVEIDADPVPTLSLQEARERLDDGHEPWVFHRDTATGRGHVLYRRYDGHYGLVTPRDEPEAISEVG